MGWSSGSELAEEVWDMFRGLIRKDKKKYAKRLIELFENMDCDTIYECEQLCKDAGVEQE